MSQRRINGMSGAGDCTPWGASAGPAEATGGDGYYPNPWIEAPEGRVPFDEIGSVATPLVAAGEIAVHQFQVPTGSNGSIFGIITRYIPGGLAPASGNIIWRLRHGQPGVNGTPVRNFARITVEWGDFSDYHSIHGGIPMVAEEWFTLTVLNPGGLPSGAANLSLAGVNGYYWPRQAGMRT